ncbi:MAG: hypothetical protein MUF54_01210 [Polyangiaceae bacterium]|jgi:hypothetical protein|nr:hypothetical protein [Polyangiaceae bacterium]
MSLSKIMPTFLILPLVLIPLLAACDSDSDEGDSSGTPAAEDPGGPAGKADDGKGCDRSLVCQQAITCVDGQQYPTRCGPDNCDRPMGPCEEDAPQCDPTLICAQAITCVDGQQYPTRCGPKNCDEPIGPCEDAPQCDPTLICAQAITCVDGQQYPTRCGPKNCDEPIGRC